VAAILAAPFALHQSYTDGPCPIGTYPVVNTGDCVSGPGGNIVVNKVGKLMDVVKCATYKGREYDEVSYHTNTSPTPSGSASAFITTNDRDVGNVSVIVDSSNAIVFTDATGTRIDTVDAVKQYMQTHADDKDFVFFFPNFNHAEGSFHNHIRNDVQGINVPIQDNSATYGTQYLKSLTLYRNFQLYPTDVYARILLPTPNNDSTMSLLAQESGHRWAAWVRRDKDPGPRIRIATDLLGRNEAHWCFYLNTPSLTTSADPNRPGFSSMEGNYWRDNGNGTYTTILKSDGYSKLDQYLLGFRSSAQVDPFFKLDAPKGGSTPDCSHQPYTPTVDSPWTNAYPKINVDVQDIIRVEGSRTPDAQTSQKNWRVAFVIIAKAGTFPTSAEIAKVDDIRVNWEPYFRDESGGGKMFTTLGPVDMDGDTYLSNQDCDEQDPMVHPGATEVCNAVDDDCDGIIDDGFDQDGDLYTQCNGDCNDANIAINPGALEIWNGLDDNCDGATDNVNLVDADNDGYYANPQNQSQADCNDNNPAINPGAQELVNGVDDNCNGFVDCADPTWVYQTDAGPRAHDGFDNDCNGIIDG
jgi:hypothetical protein